MYATRVVSKSLHLSTSIGRELEEVISRITKKMITLEYFGKGSTEAGCCSFLRRTAAYALVSEPHQYVIALP